MVGLLVSRSLGDPVQSAIPLLAGLLVLGGSVALLAAESDSWAWVRVGLEAFAAVMASVRRLLALPFAFGWVVIGGTWLRRLSGAVSFSLIAADGLIEKRTTRRRRGDISVPAPAFTNNP
jgi:hypothetical protein